MEKNAEYGGQPEILALVHVIQRPITVHYEDSDKGTVFGIDVLYYPEEHDDRGELIKAGHYMLLRRATLLNPRGWTWHIHRQGSAEYFLGVLNFENLYFFGILVIASVFFWVLK